MRFSIEIQELSRPVMEALAILQSAVSQGKSGDTGQHTAPPGDGGKFQLEQALEKGKKAAQSLVEKWQVGWKDDSIVELDRGKILSDAAACPKTGKFLIVYLRNGGTSVANLVDAGAEEELAKNIVAVGTALGVWGARTY